MDPFGIGSRMAKAEAMENVGRSNPTYPTHHPDYGKPIEKYNYFTEKSEPRSMSAHDMRTLELIRNRVYDRPDLQMMPGYSPIIEEIVRREKMGPGY